MMPVAEHDIRQVQQQKECRDTVLLVTDRIIQMMN